MDLSVIILKTDKPDPTRPMYIGNHMDINYG